MKSTILDKASSNDSKLNLKNSKSKKDDGTKFYKSSEKKRQSTNSKNKIKSSECSSRQGNILI